MKWKTEGVQKLWDRYKYAVFVVLIGAGLLLWPSGKTQTLEPERTQETRDIQTEMESILGAISGVGQVRVMLTLLAVKVVHQLAAGGYAAGKIGTIMVARSADLGYTD